MHQVGHKLFARCCLFCGRWSAAACDFITLTPRIRGSLLCPYVVSWTNLKFLLCLGRVLKFKCACAPCHHATCVVAICAVSLNTYTSIYARRYLNLFGVSRPIPYHTIPYHTIPCVCGIYRLCGGDLCTFTFVCLLPLARRML